MGRAHLASLTAFMAFALVGLAGFFASDRFLLGFAVFLGCGLIGSFVASKLFNRLATPAEKQRDLEDRVRNSDI